MWKKIILVFFVLSVLSILVGCGGTTTPTVYPEDNLSAPTGVSASDGTYTDKVKITWNSVSGASYYKVYRATSSGGSKTTITSWQSSRYYYDYEVTQDEYYYYFVKAATSSSGAYASAYSSYNRGYSHDGGGTDLSAPTGVSASDGTYTNKVKISWNSVTDASYYKVYRATFSGGTKTAITSWQSSTYYYDYDASSIFYSYYFVKAATSSSGANVSAYSTYNIGYPEVVVEEEEPSSVSNKIFLESGGNLNGTSIDPSNPVLTVSKGESITGTVNVQAIYSGTSGNVVPFGYTPSWGSHSSSYVTVKSDLPVGTTTYNASIDLNAPSTSGTYFLIFASNCEMNLGWTMSRTNWTTGSYSWNDGKDIADLTESNLDDSLSTGYLSLDMLVGSSYQTSTYGIAYVKIIVTEEEEEVEEESGIVYRALCVGIADYINNEYIGDLTGPPYDVDRMKQVFNYCKFGSSNTVFSTIKSLKDSQATKSNILQNIASTFSAADSNDISYFYFSGHGGGSESIYYICPADMTSSVSSKITIDELETALSAVPGTKVVFLDSCHSGGFIGKGREEIMVSREELESFNDEVINIFSRAQPKGLLTTTQYIVLVSCHYYQTCVEDQYPVEEYPLGGGDTFGVFTMALCEGSGYSGSYPADTSLDTKVSLQEAYLYVRDWVINYGYDQDVQVYPSNSTFTIVEY